MRRLFRFILRTFLYMLIIITGILFMFYLMAPVYQFSGPSKFTGDKLYNPYKNMDPTLWRRYNFQVQSRVWGGLTNGRDNSNQLIDSIYNTLGFDHVATSDYQQINYYGKESPSFIPTYEHGYNLFKTHQVCLGARKVRWIDLILFQTTSMKQWIIDLLDKDCDLVILAHPLLRNGYKINEMKKLTHYRLMEVLNNIRISIKHWDTALSSGQLVWIIGDDDAHNVLNSNEVGRKFTVINSPTLNYNDIMASLRAGNAYGVDFLPKMDVPMAKRVKRIKHVPIVQSVKLAGDTLSVSVNQKATVINFVGQGGTILHKTINTNAATYIIKPNDTYVRTVFRFPDGSSIYLNPIVRYNGNKPASLLRAKINKSATLRLRIIYFIILLFIAYIYSRKKKSKNG